MRIGIDFTSAGRERAGIGRYARELVRALARLDRTNTYVLLVPRDAHLDLLTFPNPTSGNYSASGAVASVASENSGRWPSNFTIRRAPLTERLLAAMWHRARVPLPVEIFTGPVDLFYSPDFLLPPTLAPKTMVTVHDLSYVRVPECFPAVLKRYLDRAVPRSVQRAGLVLADAASTRRDLQEIYAVTPAKTRVLYCGVDACFCPDVPASDRARMRERYHLDSPYLLSVSTIQPRKNFVRLIQAFARLLANGKLPVPKCKLVISGSKGWMYDEVYRQVEHLGLGDRVRLIGFTPDEDLPALYAEATLFVYPSLYEGFGLPVAEAMACGTPVVCSTASSLPEVGGDAVLYFDPLDVEAMASAMERALADDALRLELRNKGLVQVKQFSWEKAASELFEHITRMQHI